MDYLNQQIKLETKNSILGHIGGGAPTDQDIDNLPIL